MFYTFAQCELELDSFNLKTVNPLIEAERFPCLHAFIRSYLLEERSPRESAQSKFPLRVSQRRYWNHQQNSISTDPLSLPQQNTTLRTPLKAFFRSNDVNFARALHWNGFLSMWSSFVSGAKNVFFSPGFPFYSKPDTSFRGRDLLKQAGVKE